MFLPAQDVAGGVERYQPRPKPGAIMPVMRVLNYTVVITPDETGGYFVTCPSLPGLVTEGDTLDEARTMAADAILCYLEGLQKAGLPAPHDRPSVVEPVSVEIA